MGKQYQYDADGRPIDEGGGSLAAINVPNNGNPEYFTYNNENQIASANKNGTVNNATYEASSTKRSDDIVKTDPTNGYTYTYDAKLQVTAITGAPTNTFDAMGRRNTFTFGPCNGVYLLHEGQSVSGYQCGTQYAAYLTPPGGGAPSSLYLTEPGYTEHDVPINDIFGSTLAVVDTDNSEITNSFSYDPTGMLGTLPGPLGGSSSRGPWGFLYQGLESEPPDAPQLYWEPNGNIYNPDPFQITPQGPIGMGGGSGGGFPHAVAGPGNFGGGPPLALQNEVNESGSQAFALITALGSDTPAWPAAVALQIFAQFFPDLFGNGEPSIPQYDRERTQRGVHPAWEEYTNVASDWIVTQRGIQVAQAGGDEEGPDEKETAGDQFFGRVFNGERPVIPSGGIDIPLENGWVVHIPEGSDMEPARSGKGYRFRTGKPGLNLRVMRPEPKSPWNAPNGYVVWENASGQKVDPETMRTLPNSKSHFNIAPY